tara:strand:+ start:588 stop:1472 length:885 start_codon:yes stop_codon:yes gene_type:complete
MDDYSILGVSKSDTLETITKKYKKLALKYHPDRNKDNKKECEEKFKEISRAYTNIINGSPNSNRDALFSNLDSFKQYFKNINYENILNNVINNISKYNDYVVTNDTSLEKTEDLYINAKIELYDIYNCIEKNININRTRKCENCKGLGRDLNLKLCTICYGKKYVDKLINLKFNCRFKHITFTNYSNHEYNKTPGNIIINLIPKDNTNYSILNNYDLLYSIDINEIENNNEVKINILHLDNKEYKFKITNLVLGFKYKIRNLGLIKNTDTLERGNLFIIITNNSEKTSIEQINN